MTDIPLAQRTQLPPGTTGQVKPSFSLADRSGEIGLAQTVQQIAGNTLDKFIKTRAANETAEFHGLVNTEIESFRTFVAENPNAPFEDYQKQIDKVILNIGTAGQKATTRPGRSENALFLKTNLGVIKQRMLTTVGSTVSKQELARYRVSRENFINNFQKDELESLNILMVESGLLDAETTELQQEQDFGVIDAAQQKVAIKGVSNVAFEVYQQGIQAGMTTVEATEAGLNVIRSSELIPGDEKQETEQDLIASIGYRQALDKQEFDRVAEEQNEAIDKAIEESGDVKAAIDNATNLNTKQKNSWESTWKKHNQAILDDDIDNSPVNQHDPLVFNELLFIANNEPLSDKVSPENLFDKTKLGRAKDGVPGGITTAQRTQISKARDDAKKTPAGEKVLNRPSVKRAQSSIGRIRGFGQANLDPAEKELIETDIGRIQNDLDAYALTLDPDDPTFDQKIETKKNILLRPVVEEVTLNLFERALVLGRFSPLGRNLFTSEEKLLSNKRLDTLKEQALFTELTQDQQAEAIRLIEGGSTVQNAFKEVESPLPQPTTQAEFDAIPKGKDFIDTDGVRKTKQ